ncbi:hypothetical protein PoB_006622800 [Plakobranchus ocellatus]|uniref:Uncharacterized protein n=1 Tax=Plakobranchus ocellatus TaxID=259542 RepID=A0AAV4D6E5_9GAST|nr:hypothetical protein PoB_006622800 [Plakobranchus ocellatus]
MFWKRHNSNYGSRMNEKAQGISGRSSGRAVGYQVGGSRFGSQSGSSPFSITPLCPPRTNWVARSLQIRQNPQQDDLRLLGPPSGRVADGGDRTRDRRVPAYLRTGSQATVPLTPPRHSAAFSCKVILSEMLRIKALQRLRPTSNNPTSQSYVLSFNKKL